MPETGAYCVVGISQAQELAALALTARDERVKAVAAITFLEIADEKSGPRLLWISDPSPRWEIGEWDGEMWYELDGYRLSPTHWAPLPKAPADQIGFGEPERRS